MAKLYRSKKYGFEIRYRVYFSNGTETQKYRKKKNKNDALLLLKETERLETYSLKNKLTADDITYFLRLKLIDKDDAKLFLPEDTSSDSSKYTWEVLLELYRDRLKAVGSDWERKMYLSRINKIVNYFKEISPCNITSSSIDRYIMDQEKENIGSSTINKDLIVLKKMFNILVDNKAISINPAILVKKPSKMLEKIPEKRLEDYLSMHLGNLERGLKFVGRQKFIATGRLDILAKDSKGCNVFVEMKTELLDVRGYDKLCGQVSRYFNSNETNCRLFIVIPVDSKNKIYRIYQGLKHWIKEKYVKLIQFDFALYSKKFSFDEVTFPD